MAELTPRQQQIRDARTALAAAQRERSGYDNASDPMAFAGGALEGARLDTRIKSLKAELDDITQVSDRDISDLYQDSVSDPTPLDAPVELVPGDGDAPPIMETVAPKLVGARSRMAPGRRHAPRTDWRGRLIDEPGAATGVGPERFGVGGVAPKPFLRGDIGATTQALEAQLGIDGGFYRQGQDPVATTQFRTPMPQQPMTLEAYEKVKSLAGEDEANRRWNKRLGPGKAPGDVVRDARSRAMQLTARRKRLKDELDAVEAVSQQYRLPKREPNVEASDEAKEEQARYMKTREGLLQRRGAILSQMRAEDNTILQLGRIIESYQGYEESPAGGSTSASGSEAQEDGQEGGQEEGLTQV